MEKVFNKGVMKKREVKFLIVGILNFIFGYGIYALLLFLNVGYLIANTIYT